MGDMALEAISLVANHLREKNRHFNIVFYGPGVVAFEGIKSILNSPANMFDASIDSIKLVGRDNPGSTRRRDRLTREGEVVGFNSMGGLMPKITKHNSGELTDLLFDTDLLFFTADANPWNEPDRVAMTKRNLPIVDDFVNLVNLSGFNGILNFVTNLPEAIAHYAASKLEVPAQVTAHLPLDLMRYQWLIYQEGLENQGLKPHRIDATILGYHDRPYPVPGATLMSLGINVSLEGAREFLMPIEKPLNYSKIERDLKDFARNQMGRLMAEHKDVPPEFLITDGPTTSTTGRAIRELTRAIINRESTSIAIPQEFENGWYYALRPVHFGSGRGQLDKLRWDRLTPSDINEDRERIGTLAEVISNCSIPLIQMESPGEYVSPETIVILKPSDIQVIAPVFEEPSLTDIFDYAANLLDGISFPVVSGVTGLENAATAFDQAMDYDSLEKVAVKRLKKRIGVNWLRRPKYTLEDFSSEIMNLRNNILDNAIVELEAQIAENQGSYFQEAGNLQLARLLFARNPLYSPRALDLFESSNSSSGQNLLLARLHRSKGDLDAAESQYRRAMETDPKDTSSRIELSELFCELGNISEALSVAHEAYLAVENTVPDTTSDRVNQFLVNLYSDLAQSAPENSDMPEIESTSGAAARAYAIAYQQFRKGSLNSAEKNFNLAISEATTSEVADTALKAFAYHMLAEIRLKQDKFEDAVSLLNQSIGETATANAYKALAKVHEKLCSTIGATHSEQSDQGRSRIRNSLVQSEANSARIKHPVTIDDAVDILMKQAEASYDAGDMHGAAQAYTQLLRIDNDREDVRSNLSRIYNLLAIATPEPIRDYSSLPDTITLAWDEGKDKFRQGFVKAADARFDEVLDSLISNTSDVATSLKAQVLHYKANVAKVHHRKSDAIELINQSLAVQETPNAYELMANLYK